MDNQILDEGYRTKTPEDELELEKLETKNGENKVLIAFGRFSLYCSVFLFIMAFSSHAGYIKNLGLGEGGLLKTGFLILFFLVLLVSNYFKAISSFFLALASHMFLIWFQLGFLGMSNTTIIKLKFIIILLLCLGLYGSFYFQKNEKRIRELKGTN